MSYPADFPPELAPAFAQARRLHRQHGTSYFFASRLFPPAMRLATEALYGFFRVPDEIVDSSPLQSVDDALEVRRKLGAWRSDWLKAYETGDSADAVLRVTSFVFHYYSIPFDYSLDFLGAMETDLEKTRYENYAELESYMYGSAAVVGLMMTHVIGFRDERALHYAAQLGYAMQLTNFLRDIDEDYVQRNRIYMPQDELRQFGLSDEDIASRRFTPDFQKFVQFQAERAHLLYDTANMGIGILNPEGRLPVRVASALYRAILDKIESQSWNVFAGRARTNFREKLALALMAYKENRV